MNDIHEILSRFQGVKQQGSRQKWEVICPAHDDHNASAYVELKEDGWVRLGCSVGCSEKDMREAIGLMENSDLFLGERNYDRPAPKKPIQPTQKPKAKRGDLERSYYYYDTDGFQVARKDRFLPPPEGGRKSFQWFKYNSNDKSYSSGLAQTDRPLYQAHKLPKAISTGTPILFVEGEKCVEAAENWGLVATTLPDGANSHWTKEQIDSLRGATVIILPDNDDAGQKYANEAVDKLTGVAKAIRILYLPGIEAIGAKADLADWQLAGHTKVDLDKAIEAIKDQSAASIPQYVKRLNTTHAIILNPQPAILCEKLGKNGEVLDFNFWPQKQFDMAYANDTLEVVDDKGKIKDVSVAKLWLLHKHRRQYSEIVFEPAGCEPGQYNLWHGFSVEPRKGDWSLLRQHVYDNLCCGNLLHFEYLLNWMARICQDPGGQRPGVAIVLRGKEGTGKGILVNNFGKIFGRHFIPIHSQSLLTGRFTDHLKSALVIFLDEAMWGGDKNAEGVLKGIITEPERVVEPKGKEAYKIKNHANIIMASNNEWVVPAGANARRFFVLNVSDKKMQDSNYFNSIQHQMDNGGREAMLYDLLQRDLSQIDLRDFDRTEALLEQVEKTFGSVESFWYECLKRGYCLRETEVWGSYPVADLHSVYIEWCKALDKRHPENNVHFGRKLRAIATVEKVKDEDGSVPGRVMFYKFPELSACRRYFNSLVNMIVDWEDEEVPF